MKTINRRTLSQQSGQVLDEVAATGEPVEVTTKGGPSFIISLKHESVLEQWDARGLVRRGQGTLHTAPTVNVDRAAAAAALAALEEDH